MRRPAAAAGLGVVALAAVLAGLRGAETGDVEGGRLHTSRDGRVLVYERHG